MSRTTEVTIGETVFFIRQFDAFTQLRLFGDLQKEILPALGGVINVIADKSADGEKVDAMAIDAMRNLSERLGGAALEKWARLLLDGEYVAYQMTGERQSNKLDKVALATAFTDFSQVLELMYHVGKVNFADPLARWAGLSGLARRMMAPLSGSSAPTSPKN